MLCMLYSFFLLGSLLLFSVRDNHQSLHDGIGHDGNGINALLHQECGEFRFIRWGLATQSNGTSIWLLMGTLNGHGNGTCHGHILFVKQVGQLAGVAIDAQHQLRQIVTSNTKTIENLGELVNGKLIHAGQ
jgi:hypothetical protein